MLSKTLRGWNAEYAQASIFLHPPMQASLSELFRSAFERSHTHIGEQVVPQVGRLGLVAFSDDERNLQLAATPGRYDLSIRAVETPDGTTVRPGAISNPISLVEDMLAACLRVSDQLTDVNRVAMHCRLEKFEDSVDDANARLSEVLPIEVDLKGTADFILQINEPTVSNGVRINRIVRYSVEFVQMFRGVVANGQLAPGTVPEREFHAARVMLDYNTPVNGLSFSASELPGIFKTIASEIVTTLSS